MATKKELEEQIRILKEEQSLRAMWKITQSYATKDGEFYLIGDDEMGKELTIVFSSYDFLMWIDDSTKDMLKERLIEQIEEK